MDKLLTWTRMDRPIEYKQRDVVKKYITFELIDVKPKTTEWLVINNKSRSGLAEIKWYSSWRQYVIEFYAEIVFNDGCLKDIIEFLEDLNHEQKKQVMTEHVKLKFGKRAGEPVNIGAHIDQDT